MTGRPSFLSWIFFVLALGLASRTSARTGFGNPGELRTGSTLPAFPAESGAWLWSPGPQALQDPDGRFTVMLVWRQGLLEARQSLVWLADLAKRRPEIRVLSMHAPRYDWERDLGRLGELQSYEDLSVPVLWDSHRSYWRAAGFHNYPTVVLLDPKGKVIWFHEGLMKKTGRPGEQLEKNYEESLEDYLRKLLQEPAGPSGGTLAVPRD